jgi:hypothetical protein
MSYLLDDIARALAARVPRRHAVRLIGSAFAGAVFARFSRAEKKCGGEEFACGNVCCHKREVCCDKHLCCKPNQVCRNGRCESSRR